MKLYASIFYTNNLDRVVDFHESTVGLPEASRQGNTYAAFIMENGVQFGIKLANDKREIPGTRQPLLPVTILSKSMVSYRQRT